MSVKSEEQAVKKIITVALNRGFHIAVYCPIDGEVLLSPSNSVEDIMSVLNNVDEGYLRLYDKKNLKSRLGWIYVVFGNGDDCVVCDNADVDIINSILKEAE